MPSSLSPRSLFCIISLSLLCNLVTSRHIHGHAMHRHRHHVRPVAEHLLDTAIPSSTSASIPAVTEGSAVISDIEEIQNGLTNLPSDVLNFVTAVEQRLQALESMLSSVLSGTAEPAPPGTTSQASATEYLSVPTSITSNPASSLSSTLCLPPDGAGPLIPCSVSGTYIGPTTSLSQVPATSGYGAWNNSVPAAYGTGTAAHPVNTGWYLSISNGTNATGYPLPYLTGAPLAAYPPQPSPSSYTFNASADNNVAVYYGTTADTQIGELLALCQNPNVDIVILSFVYDFFTQGGYPSITNFGQACSGPNAAQAATAPGLLDCTGLAPEISGCQSIGKKVLLSLGGYIANSSFSSLDQAQEFAVTLWNLFGAGTGDDPQLRPFESVIVDGFDIDNENHDPTYYEAFALALRNQFGLDPSKTYYLSAAPQCPIPDASIPMDAMIFADFIWVQFYNNPSCNLDSPGFQSSFAAWSANLSAAKIPEPGAPQMRLYMGAGAFEGAGSGYVPGAGLSVPVSSARELYVDNLGGIMLWDGLERWRIWISMGLIIWSMLRRRWRVERSVG